MLAEVLQNSPRGYGLKGRRRFDIYPADVVTCPPGRELKGWVVEYQDGSRSIDLYIHLVICYNMALPGPCARVEGVGVSGMFS